MTQSYNQITGSYDFGSIVRALQQQIASGGGTVKEYPYNFQGITLAIQDLTFNTAQGPGADAGTSPSMGSIVIDADGNPSFVYNQPPVDGDLWFDTRQGRMFVSVDQQWYQTNGGDGLTIITTTDTAPSASNLAIGQQWYDRTNGILYIFAGVYQNPDGSTTTTPTAFTVPVWSQLVDTANTQTTATLPLAGVSIDAKILEAVSNSNFLPTNVDPVTITHQDDVNLYYIDSLLALDDQIKINQAYVNIEPPDNPQVGQFWFDSTNIEMSIWYSAPGDAWGQWVPVFSPAKLDDNLTTLTNRLTIETGNRQTADAALQSSLDALTTTVSTNKGTLQNGIDGLQAQINAIPSVDLSPYITTAQEQAHITDLQNQVSGLTGDVGNIYTKYAKLDFVNDKVATLQSDINNRATSAQLTAVRNLIPDTSTFATTASVAASIAALPASLSATGATMVGTLTVDKADIGVPAFDFSTHDYDGRLSHKYRTNCQMTTPHYATFGTNANLYEYAWSFEDNEDFCWTHGTNGKVASIDKTGIAATNLYISTFGSNTSSGRQLTSTIDVGARLESTRTALVNLRTSAATATTLDQLKSAIATALANV